MRFLSSLLALWATVVSVAYGYSLPGGYERVLFYYSYVAECLQSDNKPSTIGNGCASPGKVCNFNQFMEYIIADGTKVDVNNDPHPSLPDLERTARDLNDKGLTGAVNPGRVYKGAGNNWADLLGKISGYVARNVLNDDLPEDIRNGMSNALKTVHASRSEASFTSFSPEGKTVKSHKISPYGIEFDFINLKATREANPDWDVKGAFAKHIEAGHSDNIKSMAAKLGEIIRYGC